MTAIETKLVKIEKELIELKKMVIKESTAKKKVTLKGLLKGLKIEDEDFLLAKKSLFKIRN
jgi:hypothetical protein